MAPSLFSGSAHTAKFFDIRLDDDYIVFRGNESEAASAHLRGTVVLCLGEPLAVKHVRLTLTGMSRVWWVAHLPDLDVRALSHQLHQHHQTIQHQLHQHHQALTHHLHHHHQTLTHHLQQAPLLHSLELPRKCYSHPRSFSPSRLHSRKHRLTPPSPPSPPGSSSPPAIDDATASSWPPHCATSQTAAAAASGSRKPGRERAFFEKTWTFRDAGGAGSTETLAADNYEFPFDVVLPGSLPESIEGLTDSWVTYRFKAEIGRKYAKDMVVRKPLRIIRTLDPSALELSHVMSVENVWPSKIAYSISTPSKAVIFGTSVRIDFRLVPLLKGLHLGELQSQLVESHELTVNPDDVDAFHSTHKSTRSVAVDVHPIDTAERLQVLDEVAEGYEFSRVLELPKTLSKCMQDTDTKGIRIKHKLKFRVQLHNPDGHTSELRATLPISIFISPSLPIGENNSLIDPGRAQTAAAQALADQAPPTYGDHQFDQLYSELDPAGYQTPMVSGPATPFGTLSRNRSIDNLGVMSNLNASADISPAVLQHRLNNLHISQRPQPHRQSSPQTDGLSRHSSAEEREPGSSPSGSGSGRAGAATPWSPGPGPPAAFEVEDLSRVPSYATAIRSAARYHDVANLPDYEAATRPSSQIQSPTQSTPAMVTLQSPRQGQGHESTSPSPPQPDGPSPSQDDGQSDSQSQHHGPTPTSHPTTSSHLLPPNSATGPLSDQSPRRFLHHRSNSSGHQQNSRPTLVQRSSGTWPAKVLSGRFGHGLAHGLGRDGHGHHH